MNETSLHSPIPTSAGVSQALGEEAFLESLNLSVPKTVGTEVRLDSGRTSPFLLNLAGSLERFLDVLGEVFELSPTVENGVTWKRPRTFEGSGFAVSFPFEEGVGVFLVADRGGILASWLANPGIAGKSRLLLLAGELERLFSPDWNGTTAPETEPETNTELKPFYADPDFFHGQIAGLETLFDALPMETLKVFRSFTIRKFDGREGCAWMFGPLPTAEILVAHKAQTGENARCAESPRPVRSLECVEVEPAGTTLTGTTLAGTTLPASFNESESNLNDAGSVVPTNSNLNDAGSVVPTNSNLNDAGSVVPTNSNLNDAGSVVPVNSDLNDAGSVVPVNSNLNDAGSVVPVSVAPEVVYRFHFRTPLYSPKMRARREEMILSQIHYEHPMYTQRWRARVKKTAERFQAELQSMMLAAAYSRPIPAPVPVQPISEIQLPPMASLVETKISCEGIEPVQVVDFSSVTDTQFEPVSFEWTACGNDWSESSFVGSNSYEIQPETLMEPDAEPEPVEIPRVVTPFAEDFSEESEIEAFPARTAPVDEKKVMEIPVPVSILLGRGKLPVSELLEWKVGTILNLGQKIDAMCDFSVNGNCVGRGFPIEYGNQVGTWLEKMMN